MSLLSSLLRTVGRSADDGLAFGGSAHRAAARSVPIYHPVSYNPTRIPVASVVGGQRTRRTDNQMVDWLGGVEQLGGSRAGIAGAYSPSNQVGVVFPKTGFDPVMTSRHERTHGIIDRLASDHRPGEIAGMDVPGLTKLAAYLDASGRTGAGVGRFVGKQAAPFFDELAAHGAQSRTGTGSMASMASYMFNPLKTGTYTRQHLRQGAPLSALAQVGLGATPIVGGAAGALALTGMGGDKIMALLRDLSQGDPADVAREQLESGEITLDEYLAIKTGRDIHGGL